MRRTVIAGLGILAILTLSTTEILADGLYKGHGRRSRAPLNAGAPWSVRINGGGGVQAVDYEPYAHGFGYDYHDYDVWDEWRYGGYATVGLEFHTGNGVSLEPYGSYRAVDDTELILILDGFDSYSARERVDLEAYSVGLNLRKYGSWNQGAAYFGVGGGFVHSESKLSQFTPVEIGPRLVSEDEAGEMHFMLGYDFLLSGALAMGFELGWRFSWLDAPNEFDGGFAGLRFGLLIP